MTSIFIADRASLEAASSLLTDHGAAAPLKAAARAEASRRRDNVREYARWRQIERVVEMLSDDGGGATRH